MKRTKKAIASLAIAGMALTMASLDTLATGTVPTRIAGDTATQTAANIADQTGWTDTAILASAASYGMVDALTAGPLAMFIKAPILLTEPGNVLNADTKAELTKLNVKKVYVTSGTAVISQAVLDELKGMGITVESLGGDDRFATSANIAQKMITLGATVNKVAVAYGWSNQDAISIAPIASAQTQPILLTEKDSIPESVKAFLTNNPSVIKADVIGGTGVISDAVSAQFPNATRQYGNTAYDTNKAVLMAFDSVLKYDHVFLANGETAIDALTGAPLAAQYNAGIVLTNGAANEGTTYVSGKLSSTSIVTALGGKAVVTDIVLSGVAYQGTVIPPSDDSATDDSTTDDSTTDDSTTDDSTTDDSTTDDSTTDDSTTDDSTTDDSTAVDTATDLVVKAEGSKIQADIDAALAAANALPDSEAKTALLTRTNAIVATSVDVIIDDDTKLAQGSVQLATIGTAVIARVLVTSADVGTKFSYNDTTKTFGEYVQLTSTGLDSITLDLLNAADEKVGTLTVKLTAGTFESVINTD